MGYLHCYPCIAWWRQQKMEKAGKEAVQEVLEREIEAASGESSDQGMPTAINEDSEDTKVGVSSSALDYMDIRRLCCLSKKALELRRWGPGINVWMR